MGSDASPEHCLDGKSLVARRTIRLLSNVAAGDHKNGKECDMKKKILIKIIPTTYT